MPTVTGAITDAAGVYDPDIDLRLVFRLSGPGVSASRIVHSKPIIVDEFTGPSGLWSQELYATDGLTGIAGRDVWYDVIVERRVSDTDWMPWDHPGWRLYVPDGGGAFSELVRARTNPAQIWFGPALAAAEGTPGWSVPAETLVPNRYTGWVKTNALPGERNYFEWE